MPPYVIQVVFVFGEPLPASKGALERLFCCVNSHVNFQIRFIFESSTAATIWALMRFQVFVHIHVISELTFICTDLMTATLRATEGYALLEICFICCRYVPVEFLGGVKGNSHFFPQITLSTCPQVSLTGAYTLYVAALIALMIKSIGLGVTEVLIFGADMSA